MSDHPDFHLEPSLDGDRVDVVLSGHLDMTATFRLERELDRLLAEHRVSELVLNLAGVHFVDSSGLGCLLSTHERCRDRNVDMRIANPSDPVRRLLELTGAGPTLTGPA